jgi:hypothetical protein
MDDVILIYLCHIQHNAIILSDRQQSAPSGFAEVTLLALSCTKFQSCVQLPCAEVLKKAVWLRR